MQYDIHPGAEGRRAGGAGLLCGRCNSDDLAHQWQGFGDGTRHIRVTCRTCNRFVRYAAQTAENVARAEAEGTWESAS